MYQLPIFPKCVSSQQTQAGSEMPRNLVSKLATHNDRNTSHHSESLMSFRLLKVITYLLINMKKQIFAKSE